MTFADIKVGDLFRTSTDRDTPLFMKCTDRIDVFAVNLHNRVMYDVLPEQPVFLEECQKLNIDAFENSIVVKDV